MQKMFVGALFVLMSWGCAKATTNATVTESNTAPAAREGRPMQGLAVHYRDVRGNVFEFVTRADVVHFQYTPMQASMSGSGSYSGGEPCEGTLNESQVKELRAQIAALHNNQAVHGKMGRKGAGSIKFTDGTKSGAFSVQMIALAPLDEWLAPLRSRK